MKQGQLITAYKTILKLSDQPVTLAAGLKLFNLKKQLEPQWEFQIESEEKIFGQYPIQKFDNVNGRVIATFSDPETAKKANGLLKELEEMEINLDFMPVHISEEDGLTLTVNDIGALSPFVIFDTLPCEESEE